MAVTYGFFDSVDGDRKYSADDISNFFETLIPDGVMAEPENTFQVCENSGLTVKILPGWGFIQRKWIHSDAEIYRTLDQPDIILNRADRIVLRLNKDVSLRNIEIAVKRGTPGESPAIPDLQRDENVWEISLAYVMVWAGRTEIYQNDIGDERWNANVCGRIIGLDKISQLESKITTLDDEYYHCNGVNDNVTLPAYISGWKQTHEGRTLKIIGSFGTNDETAAVDGAAYSMVYSNSDDTEITLDFSECGMITAKSCSFAYFRNCTVKGLSVNYPDLTTSAETASFSLLYARDAELEECHIYGSMSGTGTVFITCYGGFECRLTQCSADFSSDNAVWGIMVDRDSVVSGCEINVSGTAEETVYGVSALSSHCSNSRFTAVGSKAYGGHAGGNFTECTFTGKGEINGYGFYINSRLHASNCIFEGFTKDSENGIGIGLSGGNASRMLLHGIRCPQSVVHGYSQTGSMVFEGGEGFYTGEFYTNPVLPATDTILTYTNFKPTIALTQAEYDAIESPNADTLYIITE